jgi:hypothetical protein
VGKEAGQQFGVEQPLLSAHDRLGENVDLHQQQSPLAPLVSDLLCLTLGQGVEAGAGRRRRS